MKSLILKSMEFEHSFENFATWLDVLGYSESTVSQLPIHIREFLFYLESVEDIHSVMGIEKKHFVKFYLALKDRPNVRNITIYLPF
jgi:integrase/recombinase XerD